uniref:NADH-ubiquinone oxidoreductase chain 3 n=1 Tax=Otobius megnini TaxID=34606 RepID=W0FHV4_OTOMG|nr:NADH dehydrogenase subunit 3 [Otobius megnini]AHF21632.1 NADH dehydrogenase subunit 3 [Otobius megnini]AIZ58589.1 NADH dehydrogenase subunit 3 [Otobius megnini]UYB78411.1 NADH dehydrogenase subunit 3 [Otobius megnini]
MKFLFTAILVTLIFFLIGNSTKKKNTLLKEKSSPFECGFDPFSTSRKPFSLRFFMISIIFLIFDIEIAILLPYPIFQNLNNFTTFIMMALIILIVFGGLIYEWKNGMIKWIS